MKKRFKFEERIPVTIVQYYEVVADTEEEAYAMVQDGQGFQEAFTEEAREPGLIELYDTDEIDDDPNFTDSAGFSIADRGDEESSHHCDDPGCNCSI